jgi:hypothetical protein
MARTKRIAKETAKKDTPVFTGMIKIAPVKVMGPTGRKTMMYGISADIKPPKPGSFQPELQEEIDKAVTFWNDQKQLKNSIINGDPTSKTIARETVAFLEEARRKAQRMIDKAVQEFSQTA